MQEIEGSAFGSCSSLTSVDFKNIEKVYEGTFADCTGLTSINFNNVKQLGDWAFRNCTGLVTLDFKNVKNIGAETFRGCLNLASVDLRNVQTIGDVAFGACGLASLDLKNVQVIEKGTFWDCRHLATIDLKHVKKIGVGAFNNGFAINTVKIGEQNPPLLDSTAFDQQTLLTAILQVPEGSKGLYQTAEIWKDFSSIVEVAPEKEIYLTLQQADNGHVQMRCEEGKSYEFILTAAEGWRIHTVTFNGVDVTSELGADHAFTTPALQENSTLNVAFELESAAAVQKLGGSPVTVRGYNGDLLIEGAQYGDDIKVYTVDGAMIAADQATGACMQIRVAHQPVYIVKVGQHTFKLSL